MSSAIEAWATASLYGHAPEVQVSRWGLPMITHILLSDPSLHDASENYNRAVPADEVALFSKPIRDFVEKVTALADSAADPSAYTTQLLARLCPGVLPYELDTPAAFTFAAFNGRGFCDDVMDVILTLARDMGVNLAGIEIILNMREKMVEMERQMGEFAQVVQQELTRLARAQETPPRHAIVRAPRIVK